MLNLTAVLDHSARHHPDRVALVCGETRRTYAELDATAARIAGLLAARGVRRGDRVALSCPNLPQFPAVYFGVLRAGAVVVPLNVLLRPEEIAYHLADSGAVMYFCHEGSARLPLGKNGRDGFERVPGCREFVLLANDPEAVGSPYGETLTGALRGVEPTVDCVPTDADDTAVIIYTSGTTGRPKGAELTHQNLVVNAVVCDELFHRAPDEVVLVSLPLFHSFGQTVLMNMGLRRGATLVLQPRFAPDDALELMLAEKVTFFAGVPTMYHALLDQPGGAAPPATLHTAVSGGAGLPIDVLHRFEKAYGVAIQEGYGLAETSPVACFNHRGRPPRAGSIGTPVWGVELRLLDEDGVEAGDGPGEIAIRGHNVMKGYHGRPNATAQVLRDGWLRTGDVARRDSDGFYYIVDRARDLIIRGGFNVYPRELEEVLMTHPGVSLAAIVGVPHATHGEEVKAFVVRRHGSELTEQELIVWARDRMASYKYPRVVEFRDDLPQTATGKILKRALR